MAESPITITLTTDFGNSDQYVSAMKAVILGINPEVRLVDVSHEIPPQDIMAAAWVLKNSAFLYPAGTIHLVVVDPGVGTDRNPVAVRIGEQLFVGPDNGLFSLIADRDPYDAVLLDDHTYWRSECSSTFHGRDIFAPVAAHLSRGLPLHDLGSSLQELITYHWALPIADEEGIQGWVVHIDHYGNLITNISEDMVRKMAGTHAVKVYAGSTIIKKLSETFADVAEGEASAVIGSSGMLEIIVNKGNASRFLSVEKGAPVTVLVQK